jgi:hypothetical protein
MTIQQIDRLYLAVRRLETARLAALGLGVGYIRQDTADALAELISDVKNEIRAVADVAHVA